MRPRAGRPQDRSGGQDVVHSRPSRRHDRRARPYKSGVARRHPPPDPEIAALARARLARLLGGGEAGPRRAAGTLDDEVTDRAPGAPGARSDGAGSSDPGRSVGLDDLEPARRFTPWHLAVVAAVLVVGVVWGGWSWLQARPEAVAAPSVVQSAVPTSAPAAPVSSPTPSTGPRAPGAADQGGAAAGPVVHVLGAVRHPGLVRLEPGARVEDALEAAGGLRRDADPDELNLAQPLEDGVQVVVGTTKHPAGEVRAAGAGSGGSASGGSTGSSGSSGSSGSGSGTVVDLNRASVTELDALPGVGPVTAQKILDWREQHGRFSRVEELQEVDGIGPKTYERLAPHLRV